MLFKQAGAVAQGQFCGRQRALGKVAVQKGHVFQHVLHLAAIGTGIHIHGPADGAGDAAGKGKACKALQLRGDDDLRGLAVGDLLHGLERLELEHLIVGGFFIQHGKRIGQRLLHRADGLRLAVGA